MFLDIRKLFLFSFFFFILIYSAFSQSTEEFIEFEKAITDLAEIATEMNNSVDHGSNTENLSVPSTIKKEEPEVFDDKIPKWLIGVWKEDEGYESLKVTEDKIIYYLLGNPIWEVEELATMYSAVFDLDESSIKRVNTKNTYEVYVEPKFLQIADFFFRKINDSKIYLKWEFFMQQEPLTGYYIKQ